MFILLILIPICSSQNNDFQTICQSGIRQDNTNYIHCGRKQLTEIPNFTRITKTFYDELVLNDNQIIEIPSNAFQGLRIKRLNLSGNKIRSISSQAFLELSNYLEELIIEFDSNYIQKIPDPIKINLINLRSLKLINLNISILENNTFIKFRKLEQLTICKSNIQIIELDAFISLTNLRYLNLDQNQLNDSSWNSLIKYLPNLEILILSQNYFSQMKNLNLKYLKLFDLSSNGLQIIEENIFPLLEKFFLQNNELNSLQLNFLFLLKNLKELNLDFNRLTFIPEKIFQHNLQLNSLSLQGNDLNSLTNYSFYGLKNLIHLNLARNHLKFQFHYQPFQYLTSLKILNLDRNLQMNLTKSILQDLSLNLNELSLQNCHLTSWNYSLKFLIHLQRIKLSSNQLKILPNYFLSSSVISIDLQRNFLTKIPNLFENSSLNLIDLDLSSNLISNLHENSLINYPNLKTIGLTGNPLNCNCHLKWIKQWLKKHYNQDLIKFLQWTCVKPKNLQGKQLTIIQEEEMICLEKNTNDLIIHDIVLNSNGILIISWEYLLLRLPKYIHIQIYDKNHENLIFQRLIDSHQRRIEIEILNYISKFPSINIICINIREKKICRKIFLQSNLIQSTSLILSTINKQETEQFIYLISGILLGTILICSILIIICYYTKEQFSRKNSNQKSIKTFFYHPLNILSYPQQQSTDTSECSLHSSIDTSHLTNDLYHIYQQIPSVKNCQIHSTRTHVLI